jgi:hypothetical protein
MARASAACSARARRPGAATARRDGSDVAARDAPSASPSSSGASTQTGAPYPCRDLPSPNASAHSFSSAACSDCFICPRPCTAADATRWQGTAVLSGRSGPGNSGGNGRGHGLGVALRAVRHIGGGLPAPFAVCTASNSAGYLLCKAEPDDGVFDGAVLAQHPPRKNLPSPGVVSASAGTGGSLATPGTCPRSCRPCWSSRRRRCWTMRERAPASHGCVACAAVTRTPTTAPPAPPSNENSAEAAESGTQRYSGVRLTPGILWTERIGP